ncbi:MAG: hypothetical protein QF689_16555 [Candidatus Latescibacteria bacterium]|nr:hypothetical protein [Gemmatimonadaceae bacterium]MDP7450205.1 hypothetical protein [Candidatus Latescibacterota bacterium]HJP30511.1 hypothetical protein [Candidatus Latescibacterota bacterium]
MSRTSYRVGLATVDVTPPVGIFLAGYAGRDSPSDGVYHPLRAVCIAMDEGADDSTPLLLVTIDWLGFYDRTADARRRIGERTGLPPERILLTGTHTHCGPVLRREMDSRRHGVLDEDYIERTLTTLAETAATALADRQPAHLRVGTGRCGFSSSRRRPAGKGGVQFRPSLDAPHDHQVSALAVESENGDLRYVLFSYACHPTSTGPILQIGGDYPAFACDAIESQHAGVTAAFFQGCAGDQKVDARNPEGDGYRKLTVDEVRERGEDLAASVSGALTEGALRDVTGPLLLSQEFVPLTTDVPEEEELRVHLDSPQGYVREWAQHHLDLRAAGTPAGNSFSFEVQTLRFGTGLAFIALAGEMCVEYGLRYRDEHGTRFGDVWTLGYANEMVGYIPARRQIPEGGYEVIDNNRHLLYTGPFSEDTEELISAAVHRCLGA